MNNDLGFFAITLENNSLHEKICDLISEYILVRKNNQIVIFNHYCEKIYTKNIPILPLSYSKYYVGDLIVFDIASLLLAISSINTSNIYFYAQNIPWQISYNNYADWNKIFKHDRLKIISANQHIHDIYNIVWNNSVGICEDITYEKFCKFI